MTRWLDPAPVNVPDSFRDLGLHPLAAQTLVRRGVTTSDAARAFLDPDEYTPSPPSELPGLTAAAARIQAAIRQNEPICVWGDFDVDGQTSTTVLVQTLRILGADVTYHIPVRAVESHGVNIPHLKEVIDHGARLILTCDTGISAREAVDYARARGVDTIITDHHDLPETLPDAAAVVNPKFLPPEHPLATLPGVGVAYKLAEALLGENHESEIVSLLDLVALGLVADVAELRGDARRLLQRGLEVLRGTQRLGLQTICKLANLQPSNINEEHIGFVLGPRLNALGRLGNANPSVELLTTRDPARARVLATQLEGLNAQRQLLTSQVYTAAEAQLRADPSLLAQPVIVLAHPAWPGGVIGIAASRLVERYRRPVVLLTTPENGPARGSARSVDGVNITAAIAAQKELLHGFGGHPMAAGLSLDAENIPAFRRALARTVEGMLAGARLPEATVQIDGWLGLPDLGLELAGELERLSPFGAGNPPLVLATRGLRLQSHAAIGRRQDHLKLTVADPGGETRQVLWWHGADENLPAPDARFDLAYTLRASDFRGERRVQLEFVDLRITEEPPVEMTSKKKTGITDLRNSQAPLEQLETIVSRPSTIVWAEGPAKKDVPGLPRHELKPAGTLVIWTTPPGPDALRAALERVRPQTVVLVAVSPAAPTPREFLSRLAGLAKYALNHHDGRTTLSKLAAAAAQRETTVRLGLEWLAAGGQVRVEVEGDDVALSKPGPDASGVVSGKYAQAELFTALKALLAETAAYRAHFRVAEAEGLLR